MFWTIAIVLLVLFILIDLPYFIRAPFTYFFARYCRKRLTLLDSSTTYGKTKRDVAY
jgi:hypothetical protein